MSFADILDNSLIRSNRLGEWKCSDVIDFEYWDIRYEIPERINDPKELVNYIAKKYSNLKDFTFKQSEVLSFYFWIKDELVKLNSIEIEVLTPRNNKTSSIIPSPRKRDYSALMELHSLAGTDLFMREKYKRSKYSEVFEILLALTIDSESEIKKQNDRVH